MTLTCAPDMRLRVPDESLASALSGLGAGDGRIESGLVFMPNRVNSWDKAAEELVDAFALTQTAIEVSAPVVYLVRSRDLLGRSDPLNAAVATGLLGAARSVAFEGRRREAYASVLAWDESVLWPDVVETIKTLIASRAALGQPTVIGTEHLGALLP